MRPIPPLAVEFVSRWEGYSAKAYPDPATNGEPFTIGFGHTGGVKPTDKCTKAQALAWLASDMQIAVGKLYGVLKPEIIDCLDDHQWSALLSFAYNLGAGKKWEIWRLLNAKRFDQAAQQITRFNKANGQVMQGLINRRNAELALFLQGTAVAGDLPSSVTRAPGVTPPTPETKKPWFQSKTLWTGVLTAAGGGTDLATKAQSGALTVQGIVAPQAYHNPWLGKLLGFVSVVIVGCGVAIVVFKLLEQRARTHQ